MRIVGFDRPGGPEVLRVEERAMPIAGPGDVLVAVEAAGVSQADSMQRRGHYPPPNGISPILGLEVAGTVSAAGSSVTQWRPGDRVCALCNGGGYAEFVTVPQGQVLPVPDGWSSVEAATLPENGFTVYDAIVTRARLQRGETLLVHGGTSGIGTTAIVFGIALGARVFATAGTPEKCDACVSLGASAAIDYRSQDFVTEVRRLTGGRGADVVLDIVGGDYIARDIECLALDGRIVGLAAPRGTRIELDLPALFAKRATLCGSSLRPRTPEQKAAIAGALRERIWPLLPQRDPIKPVVDSTYTFDDAARAHTRLEQSAHIGKIVLTP